MDVATLEVTIEASLTDADQRRTYPASHRAGMFDGAAFRLTACSWIPLRPRSVRLSGFPASLARWMNLRASGQAVSQCRNGLPEHATSGGNSSAGMHQYSVRCALWAGKSQLCRSEHGTGRIDGKQAAFTLRQNRRLLRQRPNCIYIGRERRTGQSGEGYTQGSSLPSILRCRLFLMPEMLFTAYPGCDKTQATCSSSKFSNLVNFEGFPYVTLRKPPSRRNAKCSD